MNTHENPPKGWREDLRTGQLACPHRDLTVCPSCFDSTEEVINVGGMTFWQPDPVARKALAEGDYETLDRLLAEARR